MAKRSKKKPAQVPAPSPSPEDRTIPAPSVPEPSRLPILLRAALIIGAALWVYSPAFHGDWVWDDVWYITTNPLVRNLTGLWKFWFQPGSWVEYYPIEETLLWIEWHLFGADTLGYHLVTVALHIANALLVWRLLDQLGLRLAWLGGFLFAVHPACVDSVAWIAETKNTLSLLPFLLALGAWIDYENHRRPRDYGLALGFFLAAMLCKITAAPFPFVILLYAWWKRRRLVPADLAAAAPFLVISLVLSLTTIACGSWYYQNLGETAEPIPSVSLPTRVALAGEALALYFSHAVWPVNLLPIYPQWKIDPPAPLQFLPWPILAVVLYALWRKRESWGRHGLLGLGFFFLFLVPFLGFVPASYWNFTWIMDHFLYLPLIGLIGLVVAALGAVEQRLPASARLGVTGAITAVVALLAFEAKGYAVAYSNEATLWGYTIERNPGNWMAHDNLAKALLRANQPQDAIAHFQASIQLRPGRAQTHFNLGRALVQANRIPEGIAEYDLALGLQPADPAIYNEKGVALMQSGQFPEAIAEFNHALKLRPNYAIALDNLGGALAQSGHLPEAIDRLQAALKIDPASIDTHDNLGSALLQSGRPAEALDQFQEALHIDPTDARAQQNVEKLRSTAPP